MLFTAILLVGLEQFNRLTVGTGGDTHKIGCHRSGIGVLVVPLLEEFLISKAVGKTQHFFLRLLQPGLGVIKSCALVLLDQRHGCSAQTHA